MNGLTSTFLLLLVLFLSACGKEEVNPSSGNTLTLNGDAFEVSFASLMGVSIEDEGHAGITFTGNKGTTAKTLMIDIEYSPSKAIDGTYSFPQTGTDRYLNDWLTNYSEISVDGESNSTNLQKGSVTVKENGDSNYTISIDLEMKDGKHFKGTYRGEVQAAFNNQ